MANSLSLNEALVLAVVVASAITDLTTRRILNAFTYPAVVAGLLLSVLHGWESFAGSAAACGISVVIYYPLCRSGGMGLGDLKLMAAIGALMGFAFWLRVQIASAFVGGGLAVAVAVYHGRLAATLKGSIAIMRAAAVALVGMRRFQLPRSTFRHAIPYGAAIAAGTLVVWWLERGG